MSVSRLIKVNICIVLLLAFFSCKENPPSKSVPLKKKNTNTSTQEMVQTLKALANDQSNINVWHLNKLRAQSLDQKLKTIKDPGQFIGLCFKSGVEWLNAGEYTIAIERLSYILEYINTQKLQVPTEVTYKVKEVLAMAYLRKAEIENCLNNHNEYSCLLPIEKDGQHQLRSGGENAETIFKELLSSSNPSMQTKWLYNITKMTLGEYPDQVAPELLINEKVFKSDVTFPRFKEMAMSVGLAVNDISGSVILDDFNNDHYLDLMVSSYGLDDQLKYFENNKKGGFDDLTLSAGLEGLWSGLNMIQADYDNDGWVDVLILRGAWLGKDGKHPNSLLRNNGDGTFRDVTKEAGLYSLFPTQTASWADFNGDGWVDLFIGNEHSNNVPATSQLFKNNGDGTFSDVAAEKGLNVQGFIKGCVWGDFNNDNYPDLYVSYINQENSLFKNLGPQGNFSFTNVSAAAKTTEPKLSFPCWFFDYNQDGWEDIFVSGFDFKQFENAAGQVAKDYLNLPHEAELPRLYRNDKDGTFTEVSKTVNIDKVLFTMGCNYGDLNNDGYPDFYAATGTPDFRALIPNRMFLNAAGNQFYDVTTAGGFGHLQKGHGVAFGDLDNDGDQDVYNVLGGSYDGDNFMNALFLNPGTESNWLKLKLVGIASNKSAIGARVKISVSNDAGERKTFYSRVNSGGSFGANPLLIEQGLGLFNKIESIVINWPGNTEEQKLSNVKVNGYWIITQGKSDAKAVTLKALELNHEGGHHHH